MAGKSHGAICLHQNISKSKPAVNPHDFSVLKLCYSSCLAL